MSGYMKVLAEYSDKAGHKDRTGHIKRITGIITAIIMLITTAVIVPVFCCAEEVSGPDIDTPSAILMEAATGQVIYEKDANTVLAPASITKIMTLILIFEAIEDGSINMDATYLCRNMRLQWAEARCSLSRERYRVSGL